MDNQTGLAVLSAVLNSMSYSNRIATTEEDNSKGINIKDLHKILLKGCKYHPELNNQSDTTTVTGNKESFYIFQ